MAISYGLETPCAPRSALPFPVLLAAQRAREQLTILRQVAAKEGRPASALQLSRRIVTGPLEMRETPLTEAALEDAAAPAAGHLASCRPCALNIRQRAGGTDILAGCGGFIHYPIHHTAEQALIAAVQYTLEKRADSPASRFVLFIVENQVAGDRIARMRAERGVFLEAATAEAMETHMQYQKRQFRVTVDQVLELLFTAPISPDEAKVVHGPFLAAFEGIVQGAAGGWRTRLEEDASVYEIRQFGNCVRQAASGGLGVWVAMAGLPLASAPRDGAGRPA